MSSTFMHRSIARRSKLRATMARRLRLHALARAVARAAAGFLLAGGPLALQAQQVPQAALPKGLQVVHGQASVATQGAQMTVRNSAGAILNWSSFNIGANAGVHFDQASAASKVLNRVTGNDPSSIFGSLTSNGQVWLLNPNGVLFGRDARVDVTALVTSTLRLNDNDFLAGRYRFNALAGDSAGVRNEGALKSSFGGQIVLLGDHVSNSGSIEAPGGSVAVAASRGVELVDTGLPNLNLRVDVPAGGVINLGRLSAPGGRVNVWGGIVNQQGVVSADTLGLNAQGHVTLRAGDTLMLGAASRTTAVGTADGAKGGQIDLLGPQVGALGQAEVDASGKAGGGSIRLGGGFQGKDTDVPNARAVFVGSQALLRADATAQGDGGRIIVWADEGTRFAGLVSARGAGTGRGGFAEVSGKGMLEFTGRAYLTSPGGAQGTLLLDPLNLTIQETGPAINGSSGDLASPNLLFGDFAGINSVITLTALNTQLSGGDVTLQATNDITLVNGTTQVSGPNRLTLQAGGNINIGGSITAGGGITLSANDPGGTPTGTGAVTLTNFLDAGPGTLTLTNNGSSGSHSLGGNLTAGVLAITGDVSIGAGARTWTTSGASTFAGAISGTGSLTKSGTGALRITGVSNYSGGTTISDGRLDVGASLAAGTGLITIESNGTLDITAFEINNNVHARNGARIVTSDSNGGALGSGGLLTLDDGATLQLGESPRLGGPLRIQRPIPATPGGADESVSVKGWVLYDAGVTHTYSGGTTLDAGGSGEAELDVSASAQPGLGPINLIRGGALVPLGGNISNSITVTNVGSSIIAANAPAIISGPISVNGNLALTSVNVPGGGLTVTSVISGSADLYLTTGVVESSVTLTGANTYSGSTFVFGTSGRTHTASFGAGSLPSGTALLVDTDSTVTLTGNNSAASVTIRGTLNGVGTLTAANYALETGASVQAPLGSGAVTVTGNSILTSSVAVSSVNITGGTLNLVGSGAVIPGGTLNLASGTALQLDSGANVGANISLAGGTIANISGTGVVTGSVSLTAPATLSSSGAGLALSGLISGGSSIAKTGSGTVTLSGSNTYTGPTTVSGGVLEVSSLANGGVASNIGASSNAAANLVLDGGTLRYTGVTGSTDRLFTLGVNGGTLDASGSEVAGGLTFSNAGNIAFSGPQSPRTLSLARSAGTSSFTAYLTPQIGNAGTAATSVAALNGSFWRLAAANTYSGGTTISNGGLLVAINTSGSATGSGLVTVANGGRFSFGANNAAGAISGNIFNSGSVEFNRATAYTYAGVISGPGDVSQNGTAGATTLTGANTYTGSTSINGTIIVGAVNALPTSTGVSVFSGGSLVVNQNQTIGSLAMAGTLSGTSTLTAANYLLQAGASIQAPLGSGTVTVTGNSTINATAGATLVAVNAGTLTVSGANRFTAFPDVSLAGGAQLTLSGNESLGAPSGAGNLSLGLSTLFSSASSSTFSGVISGTGAVVKAGTGTLTLTGSNTYAGTTDINNGTLALSGASATLGGGGVTITSGAGLRVNNGATVANAISLGGGILSNAAGNGFVGGTVSLSAASTLSSASLLQMNGVISGAFGLTTSGAGAVQFAANNTYTGSTTVSAGTLVTGVAGAIPSTSVVTVSGGTLNLGATTQTVSGLTMSGGSITNGTLTSASDFNLLGGTVAGTLAGSVGASQNGTVNVTGTLGYTGVTTVAGALNFNNAAPTSVTSVTMATGTLGGTGDVTIAGPLNLTGSGVTMSGTGALRTQGTTTLNMSSAGANVALSKPWVNSGTLNISGDDSIDMNGPAGGLFTNAVGGVVNLTGSDAGPFRTQAGPTTINNAGTFNQGSATTHTLSVTNFNNTGTVNATTGTLAVSASGSDSGSYTVGTGATVRLTTGTRTAGDGFNVSGAGTFELAGGTLAVATSGVLTLPALTISNGTLSGSSDVTIAGPLNLTGSGVTMSGTGALRTQGTTTLNMSSAGANVALSKPWVNNGTLNISGDDSIDMNGPAGGVFTNAVGGVVNLTGSDAGPFSTQAGPTTINNAGTFNNSSATSHTLSVGNLVNTGKVNANLGTLTIPAATTQSGVIDISSGATLATTGNLTNASGGIIQGLGTLNLGSSTLTNQGSIRPGGNGFASTLSVVGNVNLSTGTLAIELGGTGAGQSDRLAITGNATLGGTLNATLLGGYTPVNGDFMPVVTATGTSGGTFAVPSLPSGFTAGYNLAAGEAARLVFASSGTRVFTNAAGDLNWATPANWGGSLPGSGDSAVISAGFAVQHATGTDTVAALTLSAANSLAVTGGSLTVTGATTLGGALTVSGSGAATLAGGVSGGGSATVAGGTLTLGGSSSFSGLALSGGTLGGSGSLTVSNSFARSGGSVGSGFSSIDITQTTGDLTPGALQAGTINLATSSSAANLVIDDQVSASTAVTVNAAGALQILGDARAARLHSDGAQTLTAGSVLLRAGAAGAGRSADISAVGSQSITTTGSSGIALLGGGANDNKAQIQSNTGSQTVTMAGGTLALTGGSGGTGSFSMISAPLGGQTVSGANAITLTGGSGGTDNPARLTAGGNQIITVGAGGITVTGGTGTRALAMIKTDGSVAGTSQTITVDGGGTVLLQGGAASATSVGVNGGSYATIEGTGLSQTLSFTAGGNLTLIGGTVGSNNIAHFEAAGTQLISGNPAISLTGGASGGIAGEGNGADIYAGGAQTIGASALQLRGGVAGIENAVSIDGSGLAPQRVTTTGALTIASGAGGAANLAVIIGNDLVVNVGTNLSIASGGSVCNVNYCGGAGIGALPGPTAPTTTTVTAGGNITLTGASVPNSGAFIGDGLNSTQPMAVSVSAGGDITLNPGASASAAGSFIGTDPTSTGVTSGSLTLSAPAGRVFLNGQIGGVPTGGTLLRTPGALSVTARTLDIGGAVQGATITASGSNGITLRDAATLVSSATNGNSLTLTTSTGPFVNSVGAGVLGTAGTSRWLVYSANPANDTVGGLALAFRQYNAPAGTTPQGSGNGLLYSLQPTVTATLAGSVSKVYDTSTSASLAGVTAGSSGALAVDTAVVSGLGGTGSYADKNVGTGKRVSTSGLSLSVTDAATGVPVYGYQFDGTAAGNIGTITSASLSVSGLTVGNKVYDAGVTAAVSGTPVFSPLGSDVVTASGTAGASFADKNAGTAKPVTITGLTLGGADAGNYTPSFASGLTADITRALLPVTGLTALSKVYDRSTLATLAGTAAVSALGADAVTLGGTAAGGFADRNVGVAKLVTVSGLTLGGADAGNYTLQLPTLNANITALALAPTGLGAANKVYDATSAATLTGSATVTPLSGDTVTVAGTAAGSFANKNVGTAKPVTVSGLSLAGADAANYTLTPPTGVVADITARPATVSGLSALNKVYDATTAAALTGTATLDTLGGDAVALSGTALGSFADKNVGGAKPVTVSGYTLSGADAVNYSFASPTGLVAAITPRPLSASGLAGGTRVYDATTAAPLTGTATVAPLAGDALALAGTASASFADKNVGAGKPMTVSGLSLAGADAANYSLQPFTGLTGTVTRAPLAVGGLSAVSRVYDATTQAPLSGSAAVTPLGGDTVAVAGTPAGSFAGKTVGTAKPVTVTGLSLTGADAGNYTLQGPTGLSANVTPAGLTLAGVAAASKVYDATPAAVASATPAGVLAGDTVSVSLTASFANASVGAGKTVSYAATTAGADAANYTLGGASGTTTASITPATLVYQATPVASPAGQPIPPLTGNVTGFLGADTLLGSTTGTLAWTTSATQASPLGSYAIVGSGLLAANYSFVQAAGNATALTLQTPVVVDPASTATTVGTTAALAAVQVPVSMSTPTSNRVLDVTPATSPTAGGSGTGVVFRPINLSQMAREDVMSLLGARASYKKQVFASSLAQLEQDPSLASVQPCRNEAELASGACVITEDLKRAIQAERDARAAAALAADAPRLRREGARKVRQAVLPRIERKLALLIGVNDYADARVPQLVGAVPDTVALRGLLEDRLGYETVALANPTREQIVRAFNKLALEAAPEDSVIVYYAGHGVIVPVGGVDTGFWLPADVDAERPATWLANSDIAKMVAAVGSKQLMLVSDSCYSGALAGKEKVQLGADADATDLLTRRAVIVMSSGDNEPVADEGRDGHSVFAWHLMRTLEGVENWQPGSSLFERLRGAVRRDYPQNPQYGASRAAGHQGNTDYLFERRELERPAKK